MDNCIVCGVPIVQPKTGRPRAYCGDACRQVFSRRARKLRQVDTPIEIPGEPGLLEPDELVMFEVQTERIHAERLHAEIAEADADDALIVDAIANGASRWRYVDPNVETLRTITRDPWFFLDR